MTHIKRIDEMIKTQSVNEGMENGYYKITNVRTIMNNNHHSNGEDPNMSEETNSTPIGNGVTILHCIEKFINGRCDGHKFNPDNLHFTEMKDGSLIAEYTAMSSIQVSWNFKEPTQKEWDDYNNDKIELRSFVFQMSIIKEVPVTKEDFEKEGIEEW